MNVTCPYLLFLARDVRPWLRKLGNLFFSASWLMMLAVLLVTAVGALRVDAADAAGYTPYDQPAPVDTDLESLMREVQADRKSVV